MKQIPPIEGFFLQSIEGLIFDVKGISHPKDRIIAFVRYIPGNISELKTPDRKGFRKIYDLKERYEFLRKNFPNYLFKDPKGRGLLQAIPLDKISKVYDPREKLQELLLRLETSPLITSALDLIEKIRIESQIMNSCIGLSGSILVDLTIKSSDIDIIIYGLTNGRKAYNVMNNIFIKNKNITRYTKEELVDLWNTRGQSTQIDFETFFDIEKRKNLQGKINGIDFYIRLVALPEESYEKYDEITIQSLGEIEIEAVISNDSLAIFSPCIYEITEANFISGDETLKNCLPSRIYSVRGRYCEIAFNGDKINAKGKLEKVTSDKGFYYQLVLGTINDEYFHTKKTD